MARARGRGAGVVAAVLVAAAGVDQVREVELVDALRVAEVEHARQLWRVALGHGEAQADLDAAGPAQRGCRASAASKAPSLAAEPVVDVADAVEADADVVVADRGDAVGGPRSISGAVGGEADIEAHRLGARARSRRCPCAAAARRRRGSATGTRKALRSSITRSTSAVDSSPGKSTSAGRASSSGCSSGCSGGSGSRSPPGPGRPRGAAPGVGRDRARCMYWLSRNIGALPSGQAQAGLLQDAGAVEHVVGAAAVAEQRARSRATLPRPRRGCGRAPWRTGCRARAAAGAGGGSSG